MPPRAAERRPQLRATPGRTKAQALLRLGTMPETRRPTPPYIPQLRLYQQWLQATRGLTFDTYDALWRWSIAQREQFWQSVWDDGPVKASRQADEVLVDGDRMPGARWFPEARLNYAENLLHAAKQVPLGGAAKQVPLGDTARAGSSMPCCSAAPIRCRAPLPPPTACP